MFQAANLAAWPAALDGVSGLHHSPCPTRKLAMSVTYYVALPFVDSEDGPAPAEASECQSGTQAVRRAEAMARDPKYVGAVAFARTGDPALGEFGDAEVLASFGDVLADLSSL